MAVEGTVDVALDIFGGLVTDMAPADLPAGVSPDCQDVAFVPGSVKTRPGLLSMFSPIAGTPSVNYLKTYITQTGLLRLLALDAAGSLWKESPQGSLSLISSSIVPATFGKSASLFTREYLAIGDGKFGLDIPRQFDDANLDRVSQEGPGAAPAAIDESLTFNIVAATGAQQGTSIGIVASPNGLSESGNIVTVNFSSPVNFGYIFPGDSIQITGAGVGGYNITGTVLTLLGTSSGTTGVTMFNPTSGLANSGGGSVNVALAVFTVTAGPLPWAVQNFTSPPTPLLTVSGVGVAAFNGTWNIRTVNSSTQVTAYIGTFANATSGSGTLATAGNIPAGVHKISVVFVTRQGYITVPAPPGQWTAGGGKRVVVSNIPVGPSNIIQRILIFSLAGQTSYFYAKAITGIFSSNFIINDNTTTGVTVDFSDVGLAAQINADYLFRLLELGECSGVIDYSSRLFWWGERNKVNTAEGGGGFNNLSFDGGFGGSVANVPLGWTPDATNYAGGVIGNTQVWGFSYGILGDGATAIRGRMTQTAYQDANGVPIILPNVPYSIRARIALGTGPAFTQGTLHIHLFSASGGINTTGISLALNTLTSTFVEVTAVLTAAIPSPPSDLVLRIYADGTPTNGAQVNTDNIEVYPTNQPTNSSLVRASQVELPENYDGITGFLQINENDGYAVRSAFVLRENLYFVKEHGIYVTQDDGTNEPAAWKVNEVSRKVGTPSVNGVAVGEDWAVIADRTGLYFTSGGKPEKISQEIQPIWDRINWNAGQTLWVQVDVQNKRIYVGVPLDGATTPNKILMMDYRGIERPDEIASAGPIHTSYSGKLLVLEKSRKWSPWTIQAASGAMVLRFDGSEKLFVGNSTANGKIYQLTDTQLGADDGVAIPSYYTTYYHYTHDLEQAFQIGSHNKLFTYLAQFVEGSGNMLVSYVPPGGTAYTIASVPLPGTGLQDLELPINVTSARTAFKIAVDGNVGTWFRLQRFITNAIKHPSAPVRGWN